MEGNGESSKIIRAALTDTLSERNQHHRRTGPTLLFRADKFIHSLAHIVLYISSQSRIDSPSCHSSAMSFSSHELCLKIIYNKIFSHVIDFLQMPESKLNFGAFVDVHGFLLFVYLFMYLFPVSVKENLLILFFAKITVTNCSGGEIRQPTSKPFVIDQLLPRSFTPYHIVRNLNGFLVIKRTTHSTHKIPSNPMFLCKTEAEAQCRRQ